MDESMDYLLRPKLGTLEGVMLGISEGTKLGISEGTNEGMSEGTMLGRSLGTALFPSNWTTPSSPSPYLTTGLGAGDADGCADHDG